VDPQTPSPTSTNRTEPNRTTNPNQPTNSLKPPHEYLDYVPPAEFEAAYAARRADQEMVGIQ
jgi:hypothetical protein